MAEPDKRRLSFFHRVCRNGSPPSEATEVTTVVWLRLVELPIEYYDRQSLSHIAKRMGKAIKTYYNIVTSTRRKYAKVCVEVDLAKPLIPAYKLDGEKYRPSPEASVITFIFARVSDLILAPGVPPSRVRLPEIFLRGKLISVGGLLCCLNFLWLLQVRWFSNGIKPLRRSTYIYIYIYISFYLSTFLQNYSRAKFSPSTLLVGIKGNNNPGFDFSQSEFSGNCPDPRTFMGGIRSD
ncbi:hypothetical protein LguiA_023779 [Lonicera macranthoides]